MVDSAEPAQRQRQRLDAVVVCELGPLGTRCEGRWTAVKGERSSAVVAQLVLAPDGVTSAALVEGAWPESERPESARQSLANVISRLRAANGGAFIVSTGRGYRLGPAVVSERSVFADAMSAAKRALVRDPEVALATARKGLELWRGDPWGDLELPVAVEGDRADLLERRLDGLQVVVDALVALNRGSDALDELGELLDLRPHVERNHLALAAELGSTGQRVEALRTIDRARRSLAATGLEPGPETLRLERQLLDPRPAVSDDTPSPAGPILGRASELGRVGELIAERALVTLVGPGGVGKTRLAVEYARTQTDRSATFVDFAPVSDGELCAEAVRSALGLDHDSGRVPLDAIVAELGAHGRLLVLDNCEHVLSAVAELVSALLTACGNLRLLVTTRERLGLRTEHVVTIAPLDASFGGPGVELFFDRSDAAGAPLDSTVWGRAVSVLVAAVDGLPLAIELAAARTTVLNPQEILAGLNDRFTLLRSPETLGRHATLFDTIAWSWGQLEDAERSTLGQVAMFASPPTIDAVAEVLGCGTSEAANALEPLVRKSVISAQTGADGQTRVRVLESIREFTLERTRRDGTHRGCADAHLSWVDRRTLEAVGDHETNPQRPGELRRLDEIDHETRRALDYAASEGDAIVGLRIATRLFNWWRGRGRAEEGAIRLARLDTAQAPVPLRVEAAAVRATLMRLAGAEPALVRATARDARSLLEMATGPMGSVYIELRLLEAEFDERTPEVAARLRDVATRARLAGTHEDAIALHLLTAWTIANEPHNAPVVAAETLEASQHANATCLAHANELQALAQLAIARPSGAGAHLRAALTMFEDLGQRFCTLHCCESIAWWKAQKGEHAEAAALLDAAEAVRRSAGRTRAGFEEQAVAGARAILGPAQAPPKPFSLDDVVAEASRLLETG